MKNLKTRSKKAAAATSTYGDAIAAATGTTNVGVNSDGVMTVGAASLTIVALDTNKVYGATLNPTAYTVSGLLNSDSVTNLTLTSDGSASNAPVGSGALARARSL